jgi:transposase
VKGRKRHILTDTNGCLVKAVVHPADVQDRDGAPLVLKAARWLYRWLYPWLRHVFADGGYAGEKLARAMVGHGGWTLEIIKRSDAAKGFVLLPRRWGVERTLAWLNRNRRQANLMLVTMRWQHELITEVSDDWGFPATMFSAALSDESYPIGKLHHIDLGPERLTDK